MVRLERRLQRALDAGGGSEILESTPGRQRGEPEYHIGSFPACWPAHPCDQRHRIGAGPTKHEVGNNSLYGDLPDIRQGLHTTTNGKENI